MMKNVNNFSKTIKLGRIAHCSDLKTNITDGRQCVYFTLAINKTEEKPDYYNCIAYNASARFVERYIRKGAEVLVLGTENITLKKASNGMFHKSMLVDVEKILETGSDEAQQLLEVINNIFVHQKI